jgi:hypothetical protein
VLDVRERAASALVVVSVMHSAVDPGGGGASGAAFGTGKRLGGKEQKPRPMSRRRHSFAPSRRTHLVLHYQRTASITSCRQARRRIGRTAYP